MSQNLSSAAVVIAALRVKFITNQFYDQLMTFYWVEFLDCFLNTAVHGLFHWILKEFFEKVSFEKSQWTAAK